MNNKNFEQGRSMVEMLGVLAVIGVLSVAGIAGYTTAMRSYRTNEIVNATSMLYMMGASQNQGAGDKQMLYSAVLGTVPSGVSEITYNADKTISLAFTDTDVCPLVKNKLGDKATWDCPTLTVNFSVVGTSTTPETTTPETPTEEPVDLSGYTNKNDCESNGYTWMYVDATCSFGGVTDGCYSSPNEAQTLCENTNYCSLDEINNFGYNCSDHSY